jgi:hypothetical protein
MHWALTAESAEIEAQEIAQQEAIIDADYSSETLDRG